jgi:ketosteroid isomerase-like protein
MAQAYARLRARWNTSNLEWRPGRVHPTFAGMSSGASTPEELEALFEDAFVVRDQIAAAGLFEHGSLLACTAVACPARGRAAIAELVERLWESDHIYVAEPRQVLQAGDTALVIGSHVINVARRGPAGWRYAIALLGEFDHATGRQEP